MASGTFSVVSNDDDGHCKTDGNDFNNTTGGHHLGHVLSASWQAFFRFDNVTIPTESTITSAKLTFRCPIARSTTTCNVKVHFEAADDPAAPTSGSDVIGRTLTTGTSWNNIEAWSFGNYYDSVDITSELQAIIDRAGWASGNAVIANILDNGSSSGVLRYAGGPGYTAGYEADLVVEWDEAIVGDVVDSFTVSDTIDAEFPLQAEMSDSFTVQDVFDALQTTSPIVDSFTVSDDIDASLEGGSEFSESFTVSDDIEGFIETSADFSESFTINEQIDAFNYSQWLRENKDTAIQRFFCTLTGSANNTTDIVIPIKSFYARKVSGDPSYLQVAVHGFEYAGQISDRQNGDLIISSGYEVNGEIFLLEEIMSVELELIQMPEGGQNRSILLSGYRNVNYSENLITLKRENASYISTSYRFVYIDPFINPNDRCIIGTDEFIVNSIIYIVDAESSIMEIN